MWPPAGLTLWGSPCLGPPVPRSWAVFLPRAVWAAGPARRRLCSAGPAPAGPADRGRRLRPAGPPALSAPVLTRTQRASAGRRGRPLGQGARDRETRSFPPGASDRLFPEAVSLTSDLEGAASRGPRCQADGQAGDLERPFILPADTFDSWGLEKSNKLVLNTVNTEMLPFCL